MSRYRHVSAMKAEGFPIDAACAAAEVSTSAYYDWLARSAAPSETEWEEAPLINETHKVHDGLDDTYGSPRMTDELAARGFCANHKHVERLMAENGIYARDGRRRKVRTTTPDVSAPPLPDLVKRDFAVGEPGERTCGDITYIPTDEGWLCLTRYVLDLGSRRVVGYAMGERMPWELVGGALEMAICARGGDVAGMVFHHDRGAQYMGKDFRALCDKHHVVQSLGRIGSSQDTPWRRASGRRSSESSSAATASPPGPRLAGRSSPGSTTTTPCVALHARQHLAHRVGATLRPPSPASCITTCPVDGGKTRSDHPPLCAFTKFPSSKTCLKFKDGRNRGSLGLVLGAPTYRRPRAASYRLRDRTSSGRGHPGMEGG